MGSLRTNAISSSCGEAPGGRSPTPPRSASWRYSGPSACHLLAAALTILLSSFLLFLVQPLLAKQMLPWFGGSAGVWTVCLTFFQVVLVLGYAYAHLMTQRLR